MYREKHWGGRRGWRDLLLSRNLLRQDIFKKRNQGKANTIIIREV